MWVLEKGLSKPSLGAPGRVAKFYRPKMGKNLTNLNRYISVITDIEEKRFVIFEYTVNHLSVDYVCLPQLEYYLSCFLFPYFFAFFFLLMLYF